MGRGLIQGALRAERAGPALCGKEPPGRPGEALPLFPAWDADRELA